MIAVKHYTPFVVSLFGFLALMCVGAQISAKNIQTLIKVGEVFWVVVWHSIGAVVGLLIIAVGFASAGAVLYDRLFQSEG